MTSTTDIVIQPMGPEDHAAFAELNREWLLHYGLLEGPDERQLENPIGEIIAPGGQVFVARCGHEVLGTCAVMPHGHDVLELVKLSVSPAARGRGLGRRLVQACLEFAPANGARRLVLLSSSRLQAALALYQGLGFQPRPLPEERTYVTADVYMELDLAAASE